MLTVELHKYKTDDLEFEKVTKRQPWYLVGVAANGETLFVTEGYFSKWNAKRASRKNFGQEPVDTTAKDYKRYGGFN